MHKIKVTEQEAGKRLDLFLASILPEFSRSQIKKAINEESVKVNGVVEFHPQYRVRVGDEVIVSAEPPKEHKDEIVAAPVQFEILYEDENILAINKDAGVVVHPAAGHFDDTLANGVKYYLEKNGENVWGINRAGLVHRLDAATSGVILFAKNPKSLWHLSALFADRKIKKTYLALVQGKIDESFKVSSPLGRDKSNRKKISSRTNKARHALTEFTPVISDPQGKSTLLVAKPHTGRTHQIRVHLKEKNHPIIGDGIYGGQKAKRLMLHAYRLEFIPDASTNDMMKVTAQMPVDFAKILRNFGYDVHKARQRLKKLL